ncbi:hypothetical protein RDI58_011122 [Solanum bulbocastanum]|uniref:Uncharacterized protein n=1 Tax=Solanum bulbocastanum TaxID=147425 RepID=A0AAN8YHD5_SOLBU
MSQSAALKKKGSNPNKAQSPLKNLNFDMQYQSKEQNDIHDLLNLKQVKRKSVLPATSLDQFLEEQRLQKEHDIHDLPNRKQVKRKSVIPVTSLDQFQKKNK